jgi:hypothetical protein
MIKNNCERRQGCLPSLVKETKNDCQPLFSNREKSKIGANRDAAARMAAVFPGRNQHFALSYWISDRTVSFPRGCGRGRCGLVRPVFAVPG